MTEVNPPQSLINLVRDNLAKVRERISNAANRAGRRESEITLVGVSKYVSETETAALLQAGCEILGESRPQQLRQKGEEPALSGAAWHLIGHLQRNKVEKTVPLVDLIHGVDSLRLMKAIDKSSDKLKLQSNVLIEINCSGDEAKHGISPDKLPEFLEEANNFSHLEIRGLMTMAAREGGTKIAQENFAQLRSLRDQIRDSMHNIEMLPHLSMGMSSDFEEAILEGSTMIRVGSALWEGIPRT